MSNHKGKNNPNYKDGRTLKEYYCFDCGTIISWQSAIRKGGRCFSCSNQRQNNGNFVDGHTFKQYCCQDCKKEICWQTAIHGKGRCKSCALKELYKKHSNHPNYIQNLKRNYPLEFNKILKVFIRTRDNHKCQLCNKIENMLGEILSVHHIDYNKQNIKPENLISLCRKCHMKTNHNRDYYFAYFIYIGETENG